MQATRKSVVDYVKKLMKEGNESPIHGWVMSEILSKVSERYEDSEDALQVARYYITVTHAGLTIQRMGDLTRNFKGD